MARLRKYKTPSGPWLVLQSKPSNPWKGRLRNCGRRLRTTFSSSTASPTMSIGKQPASAICAGATLPGVGNFSPNCGAKHDARLAHRTSARVLRRSVGPNGQARSRASPLEVHQLAAGQPMTKDRLLPCPFCGGQAEESYGAPGCSFVQCRVCKASSDDTRTVEKWNTRVSRTPIGSDLVEREAKWAKQPHGDAG